MTELAKIEMSDADIRAKYPDVRSFTDRHGSLRWRHRKRGRDISIPYTPGTQEFDAAYSAAVRASETGAVLPKRTRKQGTNPRGIRGSFPSCIDRVMRQTKARSGSMKREFELDHDWMIEQLEKQNYRCLLTGLPFSSDATYRNPYAPSIDRIDSRKGYTRDNSRLVLHSVNLALSNFGLANFDTICAARVGMLAGPPINRVK